MTASRWLTAGIVTALLTGCSLIAGVDFGGVHAKDDAPLGADGSVTPPEKQDGGASTVEDAAVTTLVDGGCAADSVTCNGACVKKTDPQFGCGAASCMPCSLPLATTTKCVAGACAPDKCAPGRADCNAKAADGCEADLSAPTNCGTCTTPCTAATPLCSPTGCVSGCPMGTVQCSTSCVDTQTSVAHCGSCTTPCGAAANSDPVCSGGQCGIVCRAGYADCDKNAANGCEPLGTFYQDADGDGVGGNNSVQGCTAPTGYTSAGGDCDDANANVFPGQTAFFGATFLKGGLPSFDYNCDGNEIESAAFTTDHFVGVCGAACDNVGYLTASPTRSGAGVDSYCGSTRYKTCTTSGTPVAPVGLGLPISGCTAAISVGIAVTCH